MSKTNLSNVDVIKIIEMYNTEIKSVHKLGEYFKVGHKKISSILKSNGVLINKRGGQEKTGNSNLIEKSKISRYILNSKNKKLVAICKKTQKKFSDVNNLSGCLTEHIIKTYNNPIIPSNNYQRKKFEIINGKKWFEEYFDIVEIETENLRLCKLCGWETKDYNNKTGCFENHLHNIHDMMLDEYLAQFPNDICYHKKFIKEREYKHQLLDEKNFVICKLCNQKMKVISNTHLKSKHKITSKEYKLLYPNEKLSSQSSSLIFSKNTSIANISASPSWTSQGEVEIKNFIKELGFEVEKSKNRKLLNGKEIDLIIPIVKLAIEYDGLYYHTEKMGKNSSYHLNKTIECHNVGYNLIHIFEDEWVLKKDMVKHKIKHLLKINDGIKIGARKTEIKKIEYKEKSVFLNNNHIQGNDSSTISYGAYFNNILVGVMTFNGKRNMTTSNKGEFELTRYAVKQDYVINGLASKFIKRFINDYSPEKIISFADRRWTPDGNNNLYTRIGFHLSKIIKPGYSYYNSNVDRYKRFHKFGFGKNSLKRKFPNLDFNKTEKELTSELGYDRIWDCGLFKYELVVQQ
jgi:very-short-patch-repair endonuclease